MIPSLLLAFALGLLVGFASAWLASHARALPPPAQREFEDLIADARRRCNVAEPSRGKPGGAA
jgi:hypothetical protein